MSYSQQMAESLKNSYINSIRMDAGKKNVNVATGASGNSFGEASPVQRSKYGMSDEARMIGRDIDSQPKQARSLDSLPKLDPSVGQMPNFGRSR